MNIISSKSVEQLKVIIGPSIQFIYNPDWLDSMLENKVYRVILHELLYLIFMHTFRREYRDKQIWAMAGDLAVNEHIIPEMLREESLIVAKANKILSIKMEIYKSDDYYYDMLLENAPS